MDGRPIDTLPVVAVVPALPLLVDGDTCRVLEWWTVVAGPVAPRLRVVLLTWPEWPLCTEPSIAFFSNSYFRSLITGISFNSEICLLTRRRISPILAATP